MQQAHKSWALFKEEAENREDTQKLSAISIVEAYGDRDSIVDLIDLILERMRGDINTAECVLTTTHKAKGLEYENVVICEDFVDVCSQVWCFHALYVSAAY